MKPRVGSAVLAILTLLATSFAAALPDEPGEPQEPLTSRSVVTVKARIENTAPGKDVIVLGFDVRKGWHIYANPVGNDDLESGRTTIKVVSTTPAKVQVDYPAGKDRETEGAKWKIYEGIFEIRATVEREAKQRGGLEVEVRFLAVDDRSCLAADVIRIPLQ
jgi:cytochrome c biogenesis DsbD-like protein